MWFWFGDTFGSHHAGVSSRNVFTEVTLRATSLSTAGKLLEIHEILRRLHPLAESDSAALTADLLLPAGLRGVRACLQ